MLTSSSGGGSKAEGTFHNPGTGKIETLLMKGEMFSSSATIIDQNTGNVVATIDRTFSAGSFLSGKHNYALTVAQNVDLALMVAFCICLDERRRARSSSAAAAGGSGGGA